MENGDSGPRKMLPSVIAFGTAQIIGWGVSFNIPGVIGPSIADGLDTSLDVVLLGPTVMLSILAVFSWFSASLFERFGARKLMIAGALVMGVGLLLLASADSVPVFLGTWILFGIGGALALSTAAQIALAEIFGDRARQAIGAMSLVSGLSNTILWPIISRIDNAMGWRWVLVIGAIALAGIYVPIVAIFGARHARPARKSTTASTSSANQRLDPVRFALVAGVTALNGFITWGFSLTLIPLLTQKGVEQGQAVTLASALGLVSIAARSIDVLGNWSPLKSAVVSTTTMFGSFLLLYLGSSLAVAVTFILLYGLAGGLMAVVRATLPLTMFPKQAYARASAKLALPLNLSFAAAPPVFARILEGPGANWALVLSICLSAAAIGCLVLLARSVRQSETVLA